MRRALAVAAVRTGATVIVLPVVHHLIVFACRVALVVVDHGLPDTEERERAQACVTYLCSR